MKFSWYSVSELIWFYVANLIQKAHWGLQQYDIL